MTFNCINTLDIPKLLNCNKGKSGVAFLSACTGIPGREDYIENCTAIDRMKYCLETQLGYAVIVLEENSNVTKSHIFSLLEQVKSLILPKSYSRVIFYHFGHGDDELIVVADGYIKRKDIINSFQSLNTSVFKIFIFDSCRLVNDSRVEPLEICEQLIPAGAYPKSTNTLVVNSTESNLKAFYDVTSGCGLMTHFFTKLAPTRNESLRELLVSTRSAIFEIAQQQHFTQMLVYEDKLMGKCNLLGESQGIGRLARLFCFLSN